MDARNAIFPTAILYFADAYAAVQPFEVLSPLERIRSTLECNSPFLGALLSHVALSVLFFLFLSSPTSCLYKRRLLVSYRQKDISCLKRIAVKGLVLNAIHAINLIS